MQKIDVNNVLISEFKKNTLNSLKTYDLNTIGFKFPLNNVRITIFT